MLIFISCGCRNLNSRWHGWREIFRRCSWWNACVSWVIFRFGDLLISTIPPFIFTLWKLSMSTFGTHLTNLSVRWVMSMYDEMGWISSIRLSTTALIVRWLYSKSGIIIAVTELMLVFFRRFCLIHYSHVLYHGIIWTEVCLAYSLVTIFSTWYKNGVISSNPLVCLFDLVL